MKILIVTSSRIQEFDDPNEARKAKEYMRAIGHPYKELIIDKEVNPLYVHPRVDSNVQYAEAE